MAENGRRAPSTSVVRAAMTRFTVLSVIGLVVISVLTVAAASWIARTMALQDAETRTTNFARNVAAPLITEAVRADPRGSSLETTLLNRMRDGTVVHAVVWGPDSQVMWADDPTLIGATEALDPEVAALFDSPGSRSEYSHHMDAGGTDGVPVLEVYSSAVAADGEVFVLEWYWPTSHLAAAQRHILMRTLPLTLGSLLLLLLLVLPLTLATARQVEAARQRLTRHATAVQSLERRRLSDDLHDGVVQDLAGIGYVLPTVARDLPEDSTGRVLLDEVSTVMQQGVRTLRRMIADIKPPDFTGAGLQQSLDSLAERTRSQGMEANVVMSGDVEALSPGGRALAYRIAREGLRNAVRHSHAARAAVSIDIADEVEVVVRDDGVGPNCPQEAPLQQREHFGLGLLADALHEIGGHIELREADGGGAELAARYRRDRV